MPEQQAQAATAGLGFLFVGFFAMPAFHFAFILPLLD
jgi:hypothetical protein